MGLIRFIVGVLGILLVIGAFTSFLPLLFIGGIATGSVAFAFGFPIFLMIIGATMVYFGFYYHGFNGSTSNSNSQIGNIAKWGIIYAIAIGLGTFLIEKFMVVNPFLIILILTLVVSIISQAIKSHYSHFKLKWFLFYFLVYAVIIWIMKEYIIDIIEVRSSILAVIVIGFTLATLVSIIQKIRVTDRSLPWVSIILLVVLLVGNLQYLEFDSIIPSLEPTQVNAPTKGTVINSSKVNEGSENKKECPSSFLDNPVVMAEKNALDPNSVEPIMISLIDKEVWEIKSNLRKCYKGKYKGQFPDWIYCDEMVVSRWEITSSGAISYRLYTTASSQWKPIEGETKQYEFNGFACDNGQKVTADKEQPEVYVNIAKDGHKIEISYP